MKEPLHYNDLFKNAPFSIIPMECTDLSKKAVMNMLLSRMVRNTNFHQKVRNAKSLKSKGVVYFATLLLIKRKWMKFFHHYSELPRLKRKSRQVDSKLSAKKIKTKSKASQINERIETTKEDDVWKMKSKIILISADKEDEHEVAMADFIKVKLLEFDSGNNGDSSALPDFSKFLLESTDCVESIIVLKMKMKKRIIRALKL
jgi:hypothetical protein